MRPYKIILIEDDEKKSERITLFLRSHFQSAEVTLKGSYQSGLRELLSNNFDLLLLDMSMPTWEKSLDEPGGAFEKFAGIRILNEIFRKKKPLKTILITMFDNFGNADKLVTLEELDIQLKEKYANYYQGSVFYNSAESKWQDILIDKIMRLIPDENINS